VGLALVGDVDGEGQRPPGNRITRVEDVGHDLVAVIERRTGDDGMTGGNQQLHERRRARRLVGWLAKLGDLVDLADRRLLVDAAEN